MTSEERNTKLRARHHERKKSDLEWYERYKAQRREQARRRSQDPEFRARRSLWAKRADVKARKNQERNERYKTDAEHREKLRSRSREYAREIRKTDPAKHQQKLDYMRDWAYRRKYGITHVQIKAQKQVQYGRCSICARKPKSLHVDHDHETGQVREIICPTCNRVIGMCGEEPAVLRALAHYIEHYRRQSA